jgi:CheY-like chemotaxis protein
MSAPGSLAQRGLVGALRSWLGISSGECRSSRADLPSAARAARTQGGGSARVLVVDDDPVNLMVISALLASRGLETFTAADGAEAVALTSALHFDLVLMDVQMPILNGLEATSAIRRMEGARLRRPVPVVAYSSMSPADHILAACGMNGSLSKPCADRDLEDCLVRWCPSYCAAPSARGDAHGSGGSQAASQNLATPS